jgi:hypothetical protein
MSSTRDINIGDRIDIANFRGVIVTDNNNDGLSVMWFTPDGLGPYHMNLPHADAAPRLYHDERNGEQDSYWDTHPDFTGKYGTI